jgi:aspartyl/asparaginyl-tRNA synthetase
MDGKTITFRARVHTVRRLSAKLVFLVLRQQTITIQGVLQSVTTGANATSKGVTVITEEMVRSVEHYQSESIVLVRGKVRQPLQTVKNTVIHDAEIDILEIHLVSHLTENVPFTVYDAENITKNQSRGEDLEEATPHDDGAQSPISPTSGGASHENSSDEGSPERVPVENIGALVSSSK